MKTIYVFFHVYCNHNDEQQWEKVFDECIDTIIDSKLNTIADKIILGINVIKEYAKEAISYINKKINPYHNIYIEYINIDLNTVEWTTIQMLYDKRNEYDYCLYMHTKNSSRSNNAESYNKHENHRKDLLNKTVRNYNYHIEALDKGNDISGIIWRLGTFFYGNFWWANSGYIDTLPNPKDLFQNEEVKKRWLNFKYCGRMACPNNLSERDFNSLRYVCQNWIGFNDNININELEPV